MIYGFVGAKGGVGNTTNALITARFAREAGYKVVLVDFTGDFGIVLGTAPGLPGVADWTAENVLEKETIRSRLVDVQPKISLLPRGIGEIDASRVTSLWPLLAQEQFDVIVDAGRADSGLPLIAGSGVQRILSMDCCYQSMHRAKELIDGRAAVDSVVIMTDAKRSLGIADIENAMDRQADVVVAFNGSTARWADAGLLLERDNKETPTSGPFCRRQRLELVRGSRVRTRVRCVTHGNLQTCRGNRGSVAAEPRTEARARTHLVAGCGIHRCRTRTATHRLAQPQQRHWQA